ncbi:hypothetical protein [Agrobacterium rosae]|uniref:hypothetical protein n=1 Tax=Agrobacterium rosae TaxID=1972867 RepID=UPI003A80C3CC
MIKNTPFRSERFNEMVRSYNASGRISHLPEVGSFEELKAKYPPRSKEDLRRVSADFIKAGHFKGGYIIGTSGTTSAPLVLGHRIWGSVSEGTYPYRLMSYLMQNVFSSEDVVANLYTPGGLGVLYEGSNRFLEPIRATILPVGLLQSIGSGRQYFEIFQQLGLNTIMGAPSSVVQFARQAAAHEIDLDIRKIVYTGEHFYPAKRTLISNIWPKARYTSMFGAVEYGFAGINTPSMADGVHELLDDWYIFEVDEEDNVLVTDLTGPVIPVIRYLIGDKGTLLPPHKEGAGAGLIIGERSNASFNIAGNAVGHETIRHAVECALGRTEKIQIILRTDLEGRDLFTLALDIDIEADAAASKRALEAVNSINEIAEGINRGTILTEVIGREGLITNWRTKTGMIVDRRQDAVPKLEQAHA